MKELDLAGQRFGMLYVLERASNIESANGSRKAAWLCKCDCGNTKIVRQEYLRQRRDKCSCGCQTAALKSAKLSKPRTVNSPVGERYGRLVIVEELPRRRSGENGHMLRIMRCKCDCGGEKITKYVSLRNNHTRSCGCWWRDAPYKHGGSTKDSEYKRLYHVWCAMRNRCLNPDDKNYYNYGGRGIGICEEWLDFPTFKDWALKTGYDPNAPQGVTTIDRIDVNGNYCPENCRWVDIEVQANNKRDTVKITHNGETLSVSQWRRRGGTVCDSVYQKRVKDGWDLESALFTPSKEWNYRHDCIIEYNGKSQKVSEWAKELGIKDSTIYHRLYYNWSPGEALGLVPHERRQVSKCHSVLQYDNHGNFIREWRSKQAVEESLHIISQTLNKYIKSGKVDTHGWMWKEKYLEE